MLLALFLVLAVILAAASPPNLRAENLNELLHTLEAEVAASRQLSRGILVSIRDVRRQFPAESLTDSARERARLQLSSTAYLVLLFQRTQERISALTGLAYERTGGIEPRVERARSASKKHQQLVDRFYAEAIRVYGPPPPPPAEAEDRLDGAVPFTPRFTPDALRIRGFLDGAVGTSKYERNHADPVVDESSSLLQGALTARTRFDTGTALRADLSRESRVERQQITLTDVKISLDQDLRNGLAVDAAFGYHGYGASEDLGLEATGFGETRLQGGLAYRAGGNGYRIGVDRRARSYSENDLLQQDYDLTTLSAKADLAVGAGRMGLSVERVDRSGDVAGRSFEILRPSLVYSTSKNGTEVSARLERFRDPDDDLRNADRIRARLLWGRGAAESRGRLGPEVYLVRFPDIPDSSAENPNPPIDPGYLDAGLGGDGRALSRDQTGRIAGSTLLRWRVYYRRHENEDAFDFVAASFRKQTRPRGSGFGWEIGLTGRGYAEGEDYDELDRLSEDPSVEEISNAIGQVVQAFQTTRRPHLVDTHARLDWVFRTPGQIWESLEIGPTLGHRLYVDDERDDLQSLAEDLADRLPEDLAIDQPLGDQDFLFRNTLNRLRLGGRAALVVVPALGAQGRGRMRLSVAYDTDLLYNADPVESTQSLSIDFDGEIPLRADLVLNLTVDLHRSRIGDSDSERDFDRRGLRARVRYLFDLEVPR